MDVNALAPTNNNVHFLLCMIDVLTKKAWVRPLKSKQMAHIIEASKSIFHEAKPEMICSDAGSEFTLALNSPSPQQTTTGWQL